MNNAEYVKKLGLNYRDLTAKLEGHSEPENLYTWRILNKKTNKQIGSYTSLGKSDAITSIGEWLLQENEEDEEDAKASLRNVLCTIALEFINDPYISDDYFFADPQGYFVKLQYYTNTVNKLLGNDLCDIFHVPFLNKERKKIYIDYDDHYYVLASVCGDKKKYIIIKLMNLWIS